MPRPDARERARLTRATLAGLGLAMVAFVALGALAPRLPGRHPVLDALAFAAVFLGVLSLLALAGLLASRRADERVARHLAAGLVLGVAAVAMQALDRPFAMEGLLGVAVVVGLWPTRARWVASAGGALVGAFLGGVLVLRSLQERLGGTPAMADADALRDVLLAVNALAILACGLALLLAEPRPRAGPVRPQ